MNHIFKDNYLNYLRDVTRFYLKIEKANEKIFKKRYF